MRRPDRPTPSQVPTLGSVRADEVMPSAEFRRRMGVGVKGWRHMLRQGLRAVQCGRQQFVLGADAIEFFGRLATEEGDEQ